MALFELQIKNAKIEDDLLRFLETNTDSFDVYEEDENVLRLCLFNPNFRTLLPQLKQNFPNGEIVLNPPILSEECIKVNASRLKNVPVFFPHEAEIVDIVTKGPQKTYSLPNSQKPEIHWYADETGIVGLSLFAKRLRIYRGLPKISTDCTKSILSFVSRHENLPVYLFDMTHNFPSSMQECMSVLEQIALGHFVVPSSSASSTEVVMESSPLVIVFASQTPKLADFAPQCDWCVTPLSIKAVGSEENTSPPKKRARKI